MAANPYEAPQTDSHKRPPKNVGLWVTFAVVWLLFMFGLAYFFSRHQNEMYVKLFE